MLVATSTDPDPWGDITMLPSVLVELIVFTSTVILFVTTLPAVIVPVVVTESAPTSILPNPDVIEPEFNAPTEVATVVTSAGADVKFGIAVISSSKYLAMSSTVTCFIVPLSFMTNLSPSTIVVAVFAVVPAVTLVSNFTTPSLSFTSS